MSWFSNFLRKDTVKMILKLGEKLLKIVVGKTAQNLQYIASREVERAEASGKSGLDKYEAAFKGVRSSFPELREAFINSAIEVAVLALTSVKK